MAQLLATKARWRVIYLAIVIFLSLALTFRFSGSLELGLVRLNQLSFRVEARVQQWDWKDKPEETWCRAPHEIEAHKDPIPNVVHFIVLANEGEQAELSFSAFLAIKSALIRMNATEVKLHTYSLNAHNTWWKQIEDHVTLVSHDRYAPHGPKNITITSLHLAHQADFLRLDILRAEGGIYLDADVYPLKPFSDLLSNPRDALLGHEGGNRYGLCNAVILARPGSAFLTHWWKTYASFTSRIWNEYSVLTPKRLAVTYPDLICPLSPTIFFWPTWAKNHQRYMHEPISANEAAELTGNLTRYGGAMYENQLAYHAWGASSGYLSEITPEDVLGRDTRFNLLVRGVYVAEI